MKAVDKVDHGVRARGGSSTKVGANEVWLASLLVVVENLDEIANAAIGHGATYRQDTTTYVHVGYQISHTIHLCIRTTPTWGKALGVTLSVNVDAIVTHKTHPMQRVLDDRCACLCVRGCASQHQRFTTLVHFACECEIVSRS